MTGSSKWITKARRRAIYNRDGWICLYCGRDLATAPAAKRGLDHLENLVNGGGHTGANNKSDNLVTACSACNSGRASRPYREYATGGALERIEVQRRSYVDLARAKEELNAESLTADGGAE